MARKLVTVCVLVALGAAAAVGVDRHMERVDRHHREGCLGNLRVIHRLLLLQSRDTGRSSFPHSPLDPIAPLQETVDHHSGVKSLDFVCPEGPERPADYIKGGFRLDEQHSSYGVVTWAVPLDGAPTALVAYERAPNHGGERGVVLAGGKAFHLPEEYFRFLFEADRERFAPRAPPAATPGDGPRRP